MTTFQFLADHGVSVLFWVVFIERLGFPIPAIPLLIAAGALVGAGKMNLATALLVPCLLYTSGSPRCLQMVAPYG